MAQLYRMKMKKILAIMLFLLLATGCSLNNKEEIDYGINAQKIISTSDKKVKVYVFGKKDCPICSKANDFFTSLENNPNYKDMFDYNYVEIYDEKWHAIDDKTELLMLNVAAYFDDEVDGTPYIVVGEKGFAGYKENWQELFKKEIFRCFKADVCIDAVKAMFENKLEY